MARLPLILAFVAFAHSSLAAERCQAISDIVRNAVLAKPAVLAQLKKNPQKGNLGEPWRYLWLTYGKDLDALRIPSDEQQYIFKTIAALSFSKKLEIDADIFGEYFYLRCTRKEHGLATMALASIPAASLTHCWDTVGSRPQFQACMEKLLGSSDTQGGDKPRKRNQ
jgi:hypothetical protein